MNNKITVLMDIGYTKELNSFEEEYSFGVNYSTVEQETYIELKQMVFETVSRDIKFRKYGRQNMILIIESEMTRDQYQKFRELYKSGNYNFVHDFKLGNIRKFKKQTYE